ncbi:hypothetical protein DCS_03157 [Drechmeria coniospora]|uniref:Uncharacterized protein n=1 Tax=Drechmeria coniospora TaxID=98403 RepID=A0A151GY94_DRECN|nr:hypothetical protein DCS_03157 [Drechmeria coniospora]KYK62012.1 hypothetical protein DCS_03157 [Drechmeria coniospora]
MAPNVNKPTDVKKKDADIHRKLQIYGIIRAFSLGKVPSNDQIDVALNSFLESKALAKHDALSADGQLLVEDTREVVKQAKKLLLSKNEGNLIQDFIWQTWQFDRKTVRGPNAPVDKDTAKRDGDDALEGLRTLGTLLITNGQFRKLLQDSTVLVRDMIGDAATNAANRIRPNEDQLAHMDEPAADNVWHDKPDLSKDKLKKQAKGLYKGDAKKKEARDAVEGGADADVHDAPVTTTAAAAAATDAEGKEKSKKRDDEYRRKAKEYFDKKMPADRKDQIVFRLKKMVLECQQHPDYSNAIQTLLRIAEQYGEHGRSLTEGSAGTAKQARSGLAAAEANLRTLVERFANGTSTSALWSSIGQIYKDADKDDELRGWFRSMDKYIRRCLLEQGYILDEASNREWDELYKHGRYLLREKYRAHTDRVVDEAKFVADQFDRDVDNKAFAASVQTLFTHLGHDDGGKPAFKPHLVKDLTDVVLPGLLAHINYLPIPRIEYSDAQFDAVIENLVLESDNFMPNVLEIASEHYFRMGRKKIANKSRNTMDVKSGFPSLTDTGVADVLLPGNGFSFRMKVSTASKSDRQHFFKVDKVDVDFKGLNIKLKSSNHKLLFAIVKPLMLKVLRAPIQKAVEKAIKEQCNKLDGVLQQIKLEAERAAKEDESGGDKKKKVKETADDKKVNVAMTMDESILPDVKLPGGVSAKATEYKELARKGERWESPVFSIGNAKRSDDIPPAPRIQNKSQARAEALANGKTAPANNASAGVNGGQTVRGH